MVIKTWEPSVETAGNSMYLGEPAWPGGDLAAAAQVGDAGDGAGGDVFVECAARFGRRAARSEVEFVGGEDEVGKVAGGGDVAGAVAGAPD